MVLHGVRHLWSLRHHGFDTESFDNRNSKCTCSIHRHVMTLAFVNANCARNTRDGAHLFQTCMLPERDSRRRDAFCMQTCTKLNCNLCRQKATVKGRGVCSWLFWFIDKPAHTTRHSWSTQNAIKSMALRLPVVREVIILILCSAANVCLFALIVYSDWEHVVLNWMSLLF